MAMIRFNVDMGFLEAVLDYCIEVIKSYWSKNYWSLMGLLLRTILFPFFLLSVVSFGLFYVCAGLVELCTEWDWLAAFISLPCYIGSIVFGLLASLIFFPMGKILNAHIYFYEKKLAKTQKKIKENVINNAFEEYL